MFLSLWFFIISKLKAKHILVVFTSMFSTLRCFSMGTFVFAYKKFAKIVTALQSYAEGEHLVLLSHGTRKGQKSSAVFAKVFN